MWVQTAFKCLLIFPFDQNRTWNWGQLCLVIGDITKLQQHRKVFVPGTVLETQDFKLVSFVSNNLMLWIFVDLSIQFCPLLLPSITLPTPATRARPFQGPSNTSSPRNLNTQMIGIDHLQPLVTYGSGGQPLWKAWVVNSEGEAEAEEQGARSAWSHHDPVAAQTGRGPKQEMHSP